MSRHRTQRSYGHHIVALIYGGFRLYWTVDRYYPSSRLRFPTGYSRDTDRDGAERFAKKWGCPMPERRVAG